MKFTEILKLLLKGFYKKGLLSLLITLKAHWIIVSTIIAGITYLCTNPKTTLVSWAIIAIAAVLSAIKAVYDSYIAIKEIIKESKSSDITLEKISIEKLGGYIFDFLLSAIGILQAGRILAHISRITRSASSAISVVDDAATAVSKTIDNISKIK